MLSDPSAFGWPDETNTGVPPETSLSASGSLTVDVDGTIIEDLDISGGITIQASNVLIRRCKVHRDPTPGFGCIRIQSGSGLIIEDTEMFYESNADPVAVISGGSYTLRRCNIHSVTEGPRAGSDVTIEDCYIHDLIRIEGGHIDAIQTTGGSNITIRHNTILPYNAALDDPMNAAYICKGDFANIFDVLFESNVLNGGNFTLYLVSDSFTVSDVISRGNRWGRDYRFGPTSIVGVANLTWENNVWDDDNTPVSG